MSISAECADSSYLHAFLGAGGAGARGEAMSYEAFTSLPVILAALAAWLIGIVGAKVWDWLGDWRQARMLGISVLEFRLARGRRAQSIVSRTRAMYRVQERKAVGGDTWTIPNLAGVQDAAERVQSVAHGVTVGNDRPGPEPETVLPVETAAIRDSKNVEISMDSATESASPRPAPPANARVFIASKDQIREFLAFETAHHRRPDGSVRILREAPEWASAYRRWAVIHAVAQMPEATFLNLLGKSAGITKSRPRIKDPQTGRVLRNEAGTPLRASVYAMVDDAPAEAKPRRETKADKAARASAELADRRKLASLIPDQSWSEALAAMSQAERLSLGLEGLHQRIAA